MEQCEVQAIKLSSSESEGNDGTCHSKLFTIDQKGGCHCCKNEDFEEQKGWFSYEFLTLETSD